MITLEQLNSFKAAFETSGYSSAGRVLGKDRATIREHVVSLEIAIGKTLFNVSGKKLVPTPAAIYLYPKAKHITKQSAEFERAALSTFDTDVTDVTIHYDTHVHNAFLTEISEKINEAYPHIKLRLLHKTRKESMSALEKGQAHFSIMKTLGEAFAQDSVGVSHLGSTQFAPYAHPNSPLFELENLSLIELAEEIQFVAENTDSLDEGALKHSNIQQVVSNVDLIVSLLQKRGWSVLNRIDGEHYVQAGWIKELPLTQLIQPLSVGIGLFHAYEFETNEAVKTIKAIIQQTAKRLLS